MQKIFIDQVILGFLLLPKPVYNSFYKKNIDVMIFSYECGHAQYCQKRTGFNLTLKPVKFKEFYHFTYHILLTFSILVTVASSTRATVPVHTNRCPSQPEGRGIQLCLVPC